MFTFNGDYITGFSLFEKARKSYEEKKQQQEELYYDVQEGYVLNKRELKRAIQQGINNKIFPIETIEFEMI